MTDQPGDAARRRVSFPLGRVVTTRNALDSLPSHDVQHALLRHARGDWGELDEEDWQENERSLCSGYRLLSAYTASTGTKFWIITEADRSVTTILLPEVTVPCPSQKPVLIGSVSAAIFVNETPGGPFRSISLTRRYKDGNDWKSSTSFTTSPPRRSASTELAARGGGRKKIAT